VDQRLPELLILTEKNELGGSYARIRVIFIFDSACRATRGRIAALAEAVAARDFRKSRRCIKASKLLRQFWFFCNQRSRVLHFKLVQAHAHRWGLHSLR